MKAKRRKQDKRNARERQHGICKKNTRRRGYKVAPLAANKLSYYYYYYYSITITITITITRTRAPRDAVVQHCLEYLGS